MNKRTNFIHFLIIIFLMNTILISPSLAKSLSNTDLIKTNVNIGDSRQFKYDTINEFGNDYLIRTISLTNGSTIDVNITSQTIFTVKVFNKTSYGDPIAETTISNPNHVDYTTKDDLFSYYFGSFDNESTLKQYIAESKDVNFNYTYDSNNFYQTFNETGPSNGNNIIFAGGSTYNWHTGWLKNLYLINKFDNGTVYININLKQIEPSSPVDLWSLFAIGSIIILGPITFVIWYKNKNLFKKRK